MKYLQRSIERYERPQFGTLAMSAAIISVLGNAPAAIVAKICSAVLLLTDLTTSSVRD